MNANQQSDDLWQSLFGDRVSAPELHVALAAHFDWSRVDDPSKGIEYLGRGQPQRGEQFSLRLRYEGARLAGIEAGPQLSQTDIDEIRGWIEQHILADHATQVARRVFFSWRGVQGAWRYRDCFQLLPAPSNAPKPDFLLAQHPFVLELSFRSSTDYRVRLLRQSFSLWEVGLLLSLLVDGAIEPLSPYARHRWVLLPADGDWVSRYADEGYFIPGFVGEQDRFSSLADIPPLEVVDGDEYFGGRRASGDDPLDIPSSLEFLLDTYFALDKALQYKFLRACYWYRHSHGVYLDSQTASYLAIIQSVETLMPPAEEIKCEACGKNRGKGPTARFREFLNTYAPRGGEHDNVRNDLYWARSQITHGHELLRADIHTREDWGVLNPRGLEQRMRADAARELARAAFVNWLSRQAVPTQ